MEKGWIKIHRRLLDWEWFGESETLRLFLYLLLSANYEDKKWRGMVIRKGQFVTSLDRLEEVLGISVKRIRIRLARLTASGAITTKRTNRFTIVTICNYETYQDTYEQEGQTEGKQKTPIIPINRESNITQNDGSGAKRANKNTPLTSCATLDYRCEEIEKGQAKGRQRAGKGQAKGKQRATTKELEEYKNTRKKEEGEEKEKEKEKEEHRAKSSEKPSLPNSSSSVKPPSIDFGQVVGYWNARATGCMVKIESEPTEWQKRLIAEQAGKYGLAEVMNMIDQAATANANLGERANGWVNLFDWCMRRDNFEKVLEGRYAKSFSREQARTFIDRYGRERELGVDEYFREDGTRTYGTGGVTIPSDAPPRPSSGYYWNAERGEWAY